MNPRRFATAAAIIGVLASSARAQEPTPIPTHEPAPAPAPVVAPAAMIRIPPTYRTWPLVKTMVILPGHPLYESFGGMHHVYVNPKGLEATKTGGPFPDGTQFVFDLFESPEIGHTHVAGRRILTALMLKHSTLFPDTGGWGFQAYKAGSATPVVTDPKVQCFGCHQAQPLTDYVFSRFEP